MKITYLVFNLDGMGGTSRSAITQANALAGDHRVRLLSVTRSGERPHYDIDERVDVRYLVDVREGQDPAAIGVELPAAQARALHERESLLVPERWDWQFTALCDLGLEHALPHLDTDVLVTVTPGLLAAAVQLLPPEVVVVHQEHRSSSDRSSGLEPLLYFAPRADVVAVFTPAMADWVREQLGDATPEIAIVPNPLPLGFTPRSRLDSPLILTAGRLVNEKGYSRLIDAFALVADQLPDWRLRILGLGPKRTELVRQIRRLGLYDRVELPGAVSDMRGEWAKASICALTSRAEAFPLVVQEAMAAGVPVASYDCASGPREIIEHEVNGLLVSPESIAGMAAALLRLAADTDLRRTLGEGAYRTSRQYDAYAIAERWVGVFSAARARRTVAGRLAPRVTALASAKPVATSAAAARAAEGVTPVEAREATLAWAVRCAVAASHEWLVIPAHEAGAPVVVLPIADRDAFLKSLGDTGAPAYLSVRDPEQHGWPERRGSVHTLGDELRRGMTPRLFLEPWPVVDGTSQLVGQGCSVEVQFWERHVDGGLVSPTRNRYTTKIPAGASLVPATIEGVEVRTLPLMATPTVNECRFPVDVVYTWVDGNDPEWDAAREQRIAGIEGGAQQTAQTREASGRARFISRDELRYSLRSVHLFAPWVRNIYVVTSGQVPPWLDLDHPGVRVVRHDEILPADALPTFNSHAIETSLHHIPGLAEHWLYFNDDFFLGRPLRPEALFSPAGLTSVFFAPSTIGLSDLPGSPPWLKAAWNNRRILQDTFGAGTTNALAHAPYAVRTSVLREIEERFKDDVERTARSPFRSDTDISMLSSFVQHYAVLTGTAYVAEADTEFVNIANPDLDWQLSLLMKREQDFFCLGDHHDHGFRLDRLDALLAGFLQEYFPVAAPWEKDETR
ncbi:stealth conserved region 3 domain-containing protein [Nocardioides islandensis]|uniref:Stealth conserved region 3 domain-containing protein n=1 Tax=Nocardioides islandensis TaxID=433663 RepID=A0A930YIM1_9ACTN|nr:stealth conserved region 3 domain-containing protein [Nocardioides islandensis]MBF4764144.1 stealth conserved region 3 domain-containing protein [Nocardioides islandensis]